MASARRSASFDASAQSVQTTVTVPFHVTNGGSIDPGIQGPDQVSRPGLTHDLSALALALQELLKPGRDQLFWSSYGQDLRQALAVATPLRIDAAHEANHFEATLAQADGVSDLYSALGAASAKAALKQPGWTVAVLREPNQLTGEVADQLRLASNADSHLLVIVCEPYSDASQKSANGSLSEADADLLKFAKRSNVRYVGPLAADDRKPLLQTIATIKSLGHASILHLRQAVPVDSTAKRGRVRVHAAPVTEAGRLLRALSDELFLRAKQDQRIVAVALDDIGGIQDTWAEIPQRFFQSGRNVKQAIAWCRGATAVGSRPIVLVPSDALAIHAQQLKSDLCTATGRVTFVVYPGNGSASDASRNDFLSLQVLGAAIALPRSVAEVGEAINWSLELEGPLAMSLPRGIELSLDRSIEQTAGDFGEAQLLRRGESVALLCCGSEVDAALEAADLLEVKGLSATVLNLRYAFPLDEDAIADAVNGIPFVVIVDSHEVPGLSGRLLEFLADRGASNPVCMLGRVASDSYHDFQNRKEQLVAEIVDGCGWLAKPVAEDRFLRIDGPQAGRTSRTTATSPLTLFKPTGTALQDQQQIQTFHLSDAVAEWLRTYSTVGKRGLYFWKWCAFGADLTTLPEVDPVLRKHVCDTKTLSIVLCVLADDLADLGCKAALLNSVIEVLSGGCEANLAGLGEVEQGYVNLTHRLYSEYVRRCRMYPRFAEFHEILEYDQQQYCNTMRYSQLISKNKELLNVAEHDLYMPHNMHMMSFATLDLMCMPQFCRTELGKIREIIWNAQCMGRIGNLLNTWRREIAECDFNSGVIAHAVECSDLSVDQLRVENAAGIQAAIVNGGHEEFFQQKWAAHRSQLIAKVNQVHSVDLSGLVTAHDRFLQTYVVSRGLV